jgi:hypothetical protein
MAARNIPGGLFLLQKTIGKKTAAARELLNSHRRGSSCRLGFSLVWLFRVRMAFKLGQGLSQ